jgi:nucleoporin POM34
MSSTAIVPSSQTALQTQAGRSTSSTLSSSVATLPANGLTPRRLPATPSGSRTNTPTKTPGRTGWIHPRMDEVLRRRNATNFDTTNAKTILFSVGVMLLSLYVPNATRAMCVYQSHCVENKGLTIYSFPSSWLHAVSPYDTYTLWSIRLFLALSVLMSAMPLLRTPDACEDIPLTPQQRKLLGLPPMSRPATPQEKEQYVTPPRFSRSGTPRSSSSSIRAEASDSPLSGRGTPLGSSAFRSPSSNSLLRTNSGSPSLLSGGEKRRLSYTGQRSSPMSESLWDSSGTSTLGLGTPSKTGNNKASVGLNNKWLYEKGRASPTGGMKGSRGPSFF